MLNLRRLVEKALAEGWAVDGGDLDKVDTQADLAGFTVVPSRATGPLVDVLRPTAAEEAKPRSLSAKFGTGEQPLHTDGAHHSVPPDVVLMSVDEPSSVSTLLWKMTARGLPSDVQLGLRHGLFVVRAGKDCFLAPALERGRLRFDPGCMAPSDERARTVVSFFQAARASADRHVWDSSETVLAIDNRRVLHGRADATSEPDRAMRRVALRARRALP